ncbi:CRAL-TRIO domain-containing protein [Raphanus sativus]|nr:CRAL-TRIO domain-containing protein [Raphanus sativus]
MEKHAVVYDNVYNDFPKNISDDMAELESKVSGFLKSKIYFMEMTLRRLGGDSSFLYIFNVHNEHGLMTKDLNFVTELTKEELKLSQKSYLNFTTTHIQEGSCVGSNIRISGNVDKPNQIPIMFGGLSFDAEDISNEDQYLSKLERGRQLRSNVQIDVGVNVPQFVGQTSFTQASDNPEFTDISMVENEAYTLDL